MEVMSEKWLQELSKYIPEDEVNHITHIVKEGRGSFYIDTEGRTYLDFSSGIFTNSFGHGDPELAEALSDVFSLLSNIHGRHWEGEVAVYKKLFGHLPSRDYRVVPFGDGGAYTVDRCLMEIFYALGERPYRLATFAGGFHGKTVGAKLSMASVDSVFFRSSTIPAPYCYRCPCGKSPGSCGMECADLAIRSLLECEAEVFLMEPVLGSTVIVPPKGYWPKLELACRSYGIILLADEVLTGGGRTGHYIASTGLGLKPDGILLTKGLANGLPQSMMFLRSDLIQHSRAAEAGHFHATYMGVPAMLSLAAKVLDKIEREQILDNVIVRGRQLLSGLKKLAQQFPEQIGDVRGIGLMAAVELVKDRESKEPDIALGQAVFQRAEEKGLELIAGGHVLRMGPPLNVSESEIDLGLKLLEQSFREVSNEQT